MTRAALSHEHPLAIAHRGTRAYHPENTMPAFQAAVDLGYRYLETDLHATRDGVLVCFHDDSLVRTTDCRGKVWELSIEEVRRCDAGHRFGGRDHPARGRGIRVPSLEELVTTFPEAVVTLDLKQDGIEQLVVDAIGKFDLWERVIVGSFSDRRLEVFRVLTGGRVATSTGSKETYRFWRAARRGEALPLAADALQVPVFYRGIRVVDAKTVAAAHQAGLQVHVWTVNRPATMSRLLDLGVDGLISDRIDLLRDVYLERGAGGPWQGLGPKDPDPVPSTQHSVHGSRSRPASVCSQYAVGVSAAHNRLAVVRLCAASTPWGYQLHTTDWVHTTRTSTQYVVLSLETNQGRRTGSTRLACIASM